MEQIRALFAISGIVDSEINELAEQLTGHDIVLTGEIRTNRASLISSLGTGPDTDLLVLSEYFGEGRLEAEDIERMTMAANAGLDILMVVDDDAEDDYLKRMIDKGVYNIIFQKDAGIPEIAERIAKPLTRKEAISYCHIGPDSFVKLPETNVSESESEIVSYILSGAKDFGELEERINQVNRRLGDSLKFLGILEALPMDVLESVSRMGGYKYIADVAIAAKKKKHEAVSQQPVFKGLKMPAIEKKIDLDGMAEARHKEIAFVSTNVGVGCTYLSILCANALSRSGIKTAVLELDDTDENFKTLYGLVKKDDALAAHSFTIGDVDYYFGISFSEFTSKFGPMYDACIYDAGCCLIKSIESLSARDGIKVFVAAGAADYKIGELSDFVSEVIPIDKENRFTYFMTPCEEDDLAGALDAAKGCDVRAVGYEPNPFCPSRRTIRLFTQAAEGIREEKRTVKIKEIPDRVNESPREHMTKLSAAFLVLFAVTALSLTAALIMQRQRSDAAIMQAENKAERQEETIAGYSKKIEELKLLEKEKERTVCILKSPVTIGTRMSEDMITQKVIHSDMPQNVYAGMDEIAGKYAACNITAGVPLYHYFVADPAEALPEYVEKGPELSEAGMELSVSGPEGEKP